MASGPRIVRSTSTSPFDKPLLLGLLARPHAALRDGVNLLGRAVARSRHFLDELVVKRLELLVELLAFVGRVPADRRLDLRVFPDARRGDVRAELFVHAAGDNLSAEDADRS